MTIFVLAVCLRQKRLFMVPEQEQPEPVPEMETEEQLVADPTQEKVPQLRRSSRVRRPTVKLKEGGM